MALYLGSSKRAACVFQSGDGSSSGTALKSWSMINGQCAVTAEDYETYFMHNESSPKTRIFSITMNLAPVGMDGSTAGGPASYWSEPADESTPCLIGFLMLNASNFDHDTGELTDEPMNEYYVTIGVNNSEDGNYTMSILRAQLTGTDVTAAFTASEVPQVLYVTYLEDSAF